MLKQLFYRDSLKYGQFRERILEDNIIRIKMFSLLILILEAMFLVCSFLFKGWIPIDLLFDYRYHYLFLLVGSIVVLTLVHLYKKNKYNRLYEMMIYTVVLIALLWGASVTILDISVHNTTTVYLTFVFILSVAIVLRPEIYFIILLLVQIVFLLRVPGSLHMESIQINTSIFTVFAWFVSRYQFLTVYEKYKREIVIKDKNDVLEKQNVELVRLMMTDHLTGMYNRYSLDDILSKKWVEAYVHKSYITVLMMDIDLFKSFNDNYGHIIGDTCIQEVGQVLNGISDQYEGYAFRYGGDEFCLILSEIQDKDAVVEEITRKIKAIKIEVGSQSVSVELSIGIFHEIPSESINNWQCIDFADKDLYIQKSKRRRRSSDGL